MLGKIAVYSSVSRVFKAASILLSQPIDVEHPELDLGDPHPFMVIRNATIPMFDSAELDLESVSARLQDMPARDFAVDASFLEGPPKPREIRLRAPKIDVPDVHGHVPGVSEHRETAVHDWLDAHLITDRDYLTGECHEPIEVLPISGGCRYFTHIGTEHEATH